MEMHRIQGLAALFFDNLQKTLQKLVWKHTKFYTMTHYNENTINLYTELPKNSLKCKKMFKQIYSCLIYSEICKKFFKL